MNAAQLLKAYGKLPKVTAANLPSVWVGESETIELANRTCGTPDAADHEIAATEYGEIDTLAKLLGMDRDECIEWIDMHRRMLDSDAGDYNGNRWPKCVAAFPNNHALTYFLDVSTFDDVHKHPVTREELELIVEAKVFRWTREQLLDECLGKPMVEMAYDYFIAESYRVLGCQHVRVDDKSKANIHIYATHLGGRIIGRAWFTNGNCSDRVDHQISVTYHPSLIGMCKLGGHEFGHGHGEQHQFSGNNQSVMSYNPPRLFYGFSTGKPPHSLARDLSLNSLEEKYGGQPVPLKDSPPVPPVPPAEKDLPKTLTRPNGVIAMNGELYKFWIEKA